MVLTETSTNPLGMPVVGFGTYQLNSEQAESCVAQALSAGYRHIDSAAGYNNEAGTGRAIRSSGMDRNQIFITTKLFPGYQQWGAPEKNYQQTIDALKQQLSDLQLDYVDLYLIHAPLSELRLEQWQGLMELQKLGLTRHIGVSNYNEDKILEIQNAGLAKPAANQIEFHPLCTRVPLSGFMQRESIVPIAYSSLAPLATWRMEAGQGGEVMAEIKVEAQRLISEIAANLNVSAAKVLLRWGLQHGYSVLTKSSNPDRIRANRELFDFHIPASAMQRLDELNQDQALAWAANGINPMEVS
ncbi:MAG: aldo/keto reductase [Leptospiraceae bacterium]|nr:aldo/keto reductase [Leptospiraceae bacterium]